MKSQVVVQVKAGPSSGNPLQHFRAPAFCALLLIVTVALAGCDGTTNRSAETAAPEVAAAPKASGYGMDLVAVNTAFPLKEDAAATNAAFPDHITKPDEVFKVQVLLRDGKKVDAGTHLFGPVNVIPYADSTNALDAAGGTHRGDEVVARYFAPGEIGYAIKHHRPLHRVVNLSAGAEAMDKEEIKLQDTHIEIIVGVEQNGKPGIVTVNNPQSYQHGGFGHESTDADYPMVFTKPRFLGKLPPETRAQFVENIRTMAVLLNTVTEFPGDYNGGDPLSCDSPEKIRTFVKMAIKAVAGDTNAHAFFEKEENNLYCAELAFTATTAGILVPLNWNSVRALGVTEGEWAAFKSEVALHNERNPEKPSFFVKNNSNSKIDRIQLADLDKLENLKPLPEYSTKPAEDAQKLAFKPMTAADMIECFLRFYLPRKEIGESVAPCQAEALSALKPGLLEMMKVKADSPQGQAAGQLIDELVVVVGKQYASYDAFRATLEPLMQKARLACGPRDNNHLFTPPSLFHALLKSGDTYNGLLGLDYVGHGLHFSLVKPQ